MAKLVRVKVQVFIMLQFYIKWHSRARRKTNFMKQNESSYENWHRNPGTLKDFHLQQTD